MAVNNQRMQDTATATLNFNEVNLADVRTALQQEKEDASPIAKVYTMAQANSPCEVKVTRGSRRICVAALLK